MSPRRPGHRTEPGTSAKALSAMAEAARRARAVDGDAQEQSPAPQHQHPDPRVTEERDPRSHVTASRRPVPVPPPEVTPRVAEPLPPPTPPPEPPPPRRSPPSHAGPPVLFFDALAEEQADAGAGHTAAGPLGPGSTVDGAAAVAPADGHRQEVQRSRHHDQGLRRAVTVVSAALVVVLAALLGSVLTHDGAPPVTSGTPPSSAPAAQPTSTVPTTSPVTTTSVPAGTAPPPTSTTTTTVPPPTQPPAPVGAPVLTSLQPPSGSAGQSVVVSGSGFLSPSGRISATVGGQVAPVSCPDQTTCTLTIPPQTGTTPAAPVVIVTDSGSSNPLTFTLS